MDQLSGAFLGVYIADVPLVPRRSAGVHFKYRYAISQIHSMPSEHRFGSSLAALFCCFVHHFIPVGVSRKTLCKVFAAYYMRIKHKPKKKKNTTSFRVVPMELLFSLTLHERAGCRQGARCHTHNINAAFGPYNLT